MIFYRNRLLFGIVKRLITAVFTVIYKIVSVFNLQITLLVLLIGLVLYITGALDASPTLNLVFQVVLVLSVVYAIVATLRKLLGFNKKVKKSKGAQIVPSDGGQAVKEAERAPAAEIRKVQPETPIYFRVKQNPEYVMAEYGDRYELFRITDGGLKKIRTDYK